MYIFDKTKNLRNLRIKISPKIKKIKIVFVKNPKIIQGEPNTTTDLVESFNKI